jgi:hypothetical protein
VVTLQLSRGGGSLTGPTAGYAHASGGRAWQPYSNHHFRPPPPHQRTGDVPGQRMQHYGFASPLDVPSKALGDSGEELLRPPKFLSWA